MYSALNFFFVLFSCYTNINLSTPALFRGQAKMHATHAMLFPFFGDRNSDYWLLTIPLLWGSIWPLILFLFAALMLEETVKIFEPRLTPTPTPTRCFNIWIKSQHLSVTAKTKQKGQILAQKFGAGARGALWWGGGPRDRCSRGTGIGMGLGLGWGWGWWGAYGRLPATEVCKSAHICKVYPN